eukprot:5850586-Pyramimonas_sp.AAC.1
MSSSGSGGRLPGGSGGGGLGCSFALPLQNSTAGKYGRTLKLPMRKCTRMSDADAKSRNVSTVNACSKGRSSNARHDNTHCARTGA